MANLMSDLVGFALTLTTRSKKESRVKAPSPSRFSPRNLNRPASKLNTRGRLLKRGINYTSYNIYSMDKSVILGIPIPGIKMGIG